MRYACVIIGALVLASAQATPRAAIVRPTGSLQTAIDSSRPGDTLYLPAGTYEGDLILRKRVTLFGIGRPVVRGSGRGSVITIVADSCAVRGLVVEHSGPMLADEHAGVLLKSNFNTLEGNEVRDVLFGIYLYHSGHNVLVDNVVAGRKHLDLGERGSGIHIWNSRHNRCSGNVIRDARDGFYIQNASHTFLDRNEVSGVRYGLHYMYADSNIFIRNRFLNNVAGAAIMYSRGIRMRHNVFSHNRGFSSFGILFQDCHGLEADSNVIADNVVGIFFEASTNNRFRNNIVAQNDVGLQMFQNSVNNTFTENNFIDNLSPLWIVGKRTESHWSEGGRGNYWSPYDGYDMNSDGIGDIPMKIQNVFQYLEGQNQNVRLYLYSPASQALAVAAKAFPIIEINRESDPSPLVRPFDARSLPAVAILVPIHEPAPAWGMRSLATWFVLPLAGLFAGGYAYRHFLRRGKR
jgi:nitrous oxidase accessory protein